jgi:uncharacterized protein (DUF927 family)
MKTRIHVNQHVIRRNIKLTKNTPDALHEPPITVKQGKTNTYCKEVEVLGPSKVVYSPDQPLSCGAKVWIETDHEVKITG